MARNVWLPSHENSNVTSPAGKVLGNCYILIPKLRKGWGRWGVEPLFKITLTLRRYSSISLIKLYKKNKAKKTLRNIYNTLRRFSSISLIKL